MSCQQQVSKSLYRACVQSISALATWLSSESLRERTAAEYIKPGAFQ